jgi:hypothetical protein
MPVRTPGCRYERGQGGHRPSVSISGSSDSMVEPSKH